jgi:hypothetical protein
VLCICADECILVVGAIVVVIVAAVVTIVVVEIRELSRIFGSKRG